MDNSLVYRKPGLGVRRVKKKINPGMVPTWKMMEKARFLAFTKKGKDTQLEPHVQFVSGPILHVRNQTLTCDSCACFSASFKRCSRHPSLTPKMLSPSLLLVATAAKLLDTWHCDNTPTHRVCPSRITKLVHALHGALGQRSIQHAILC